MLSEKITAFSSDVTFTLVAGRNPLGDNGIKLANESNFAEKFIRLVVVDPLGLVVVVPLGLGAVVPLGFVVAIPLGFVVVDPLGLVVVVPIGLAVDPF